MKHNDFYIDVINSLTKEQATYVDPLARKATAAFKQKKRQVVEDDLLFDDILEEDNGLSFIEDEADLLELRASYEQQNAIFD